MASPLAVGVLLLVDASELVAGDAGVAASVTAVADESVELVASSA